jgi:DNA invertase Pin-like site-specific DNA recombinase
MRWTEALVKTARCPVWCWGEREVIMNIGHSGRASTSSPPRAYVGYPGNLDDVVAYTRDIGHDPRGRQAISSRTAISVPKQHAVRGAAYDRASAGLDCGRRPRHCKGMNELLVGYARVSTSKQDLTAQRGGLHALGVGDDRIYVDHGLTGTNRDRPGLRLALAACRAGDTFVVTKLDRLARSLPDARDILDELTRRNVKLSIGGSIHDPTDPVGRLLFNVLATVAEFEADLIRLRTREGMQVASQGPAARQAAEAEAKPPMAYSIQQNFNVKRRIRSMSAQTTVDQISRFE